jgi:hypothetical protein
VNLAMVRQRAAAISVQAAPATLSPGDLHDSLRFLVAYQAALLEELLASIDAMHADPADG